jgi:hypothetical protein
MMTCKRTPEIRLTMKVLKLPPSPRVPGFSRLPAAAPTPPKKTVSLGLELAFAFASR